MISFTSIILAFIFFKYSFEKAYFLLENLFTPPPKEKKMISLISVVLVYFFKKKYILF